MARRFYELPPLTALAVFEASARQLSFKLAASELNVTPGAVSRQIKVLEEELNLQLFVRGSTGVRLTSAGEDLYSVLASSFSRVSEVVRELKRGDPARNVTLACTDAFATMWLIPRMADFWRRYPDIAVDHLISDNPRDFRRGEVDLRIRYGSGAWPDENPELLLDDTIFPVCGAEFADENRNVPTKELWHLPLLHVDWVDPEWADWDEVLRRADIAHRPLKGRRFGKFSVALQAAQANQGIAVGWGRLVHDLIESGKLVRFTRLEMPAPGGYYLTWNENRILSPAAETLRHWLREICASEMARRPSNSRRQRATRMDVRRSLATE